MAKLWDIPIIVRRGKDRWVIDGPQAALKLLEEIPELERGYLFALAKRRCEANIHGRASDGSAQLALQSAIVESGIFS
jgi:hypothetical protein